MNRKVGYFSLTAPPAPAPPDSPVELEPRLVVVTVTEATVEVFRRVLLVHDHYHVIAIQTTYGGSQAGTSGRRTIRGTPVDGLASGTVVWSAMLVRTVMDAELEPVLAAEAVEVTGAGAAKGLGLTKHVLGACFLGEVRITASSTSSIAPSFDEMV